MTERTKRWFVRYDDNWPYVARGEKSRIAGPYRSEERANIARNNLVNLGGTTGFEVFFAYISSEIKIIQ